MAHGDEFSTGGGQRITSGVEQAALTLKTAMQELISVPEIPPRSKSRAKHKDTGDLHEAFKINGPAVQGDQVIASVGAKPGIRNFSWYGTK